MKGWMNEWMNECGVAKSVCVCKDLKYKTFWRLLFYFILIWILLVTKISIKYEVIGVVTWGGSPIHGGSSFLSLSFWLWLTFWCRLIFYSLCFLLSNQLFWQAADLNIVWLNQLLYIFSERIALELSAVFMLKGHLFNLIYWTAHCFNGLRLFLFIYCFVEIVLLVELLLRIKHI